MSEKEKTMHEFYASYGIEIDEFINGFDEDGFEYFYENIILKMGSKPHVEFDSYKIKLDKTYEFGVDATGRVYELIHKFEGLEITLEYTENIDYNHKVCNMFINYTVNGISDFIYSNFYNPYDLESDCDELLEKLRNAKLKALIDGF